MRSKEPSIYPLYITPSICLDKNRYFRYCHYMASKKKNTKNKKTPINKELGSKIQYLQKLIDISLNQVDGKSEELDNLFTNQANRLKVQLDKLKENQ